MSKKVLLELCMSPDLGGLELYMTHCVIALEKDFKVIAVYNKQSKLENFLSENKQSVVFEKNSNIFMFNSAIKLAKVIDTMQVDIIHLHWTKDLPFVILAKIFSKRKPKIVQTRHMTMTRFKNDFYHRFLYKHIDLILSVTYQVENQLKKFIDERVRPNIQTLYIGTDKITLLEKSELIKFKQKIGLSNTTYNVGMVGRINEAKGQHLLIQAVARLSNKDINVYFVGDEMQTGYIQSLENLADTLGVKERVHFLGFMKTPRYFYQACDVMVTASKKETFGLVVIEAMQAATCVIGSNRGGIIEIIDDAETGLLFETESITSLSEKIIFLYENGEIAKKYAENAQKKVEKKFSSIVQFKKLSKILEGLVES